MDRRKLTAKPTKQKPRPKRNCKPQSPDVVQEFKSAASRANNANGDHLSRDEGDGTLTLVSLSPRIRTLDEALTYGEVDRAVWEVDTYQVTSWEMGQKVEAMVGRSKITIGSAVTPLWRVAVKLRRIVSHNIVKAAELFVERLKKHSPTYPKLPKPKKSVHFAEFSIYDHHFGKLAWSPECGENYDLKIAERLYLNAVDDLLLYWSNIDIERYYLPIGHDLLHVDSNANTTTAGTPQHVDGRIPKVFDAALQAVTLAIRRMAERAHVEVIHVPGNHDLLTSWFLAKCLEAEFRTHSNVTIDAGPAKRKYRTRGVNLFGYTHGDTGLARLQSNMACEMPEAFARCTNKQFRLGHFHKKKKLHTIGSNMDGDVEVCFMPSMCGTDKWHFDEGYVGGRKSAEVWLWSDTDGYVGHFSANARL